MKADVASITTFSLLLIICIHKQLKCQQKRRKPNKSKSKRHHHHLSHPFNNTLLPCPAPEMKVKALVAFKSKISNPCRKLLVLLRLKKPRYTRSRTPLSPPSSPWKTCRACTSFPALRGRRKPREMNRVRELRGAPEASGREKLISPLPITPVSAKKVVPTCDEKNNVVEEACRSFEKYLLEMIVEEENVRDLMDVEELLYCWKKLKSPVFVELVSRFYGELCKDLFSPEES